jgi:hypothetical protein
VESQGLVRTIKGTEKVRQVLTCRLGNRLLLPPQHGHAQMASALEAEQAAKRCTPITAMVAQLLLSVSPHPTRGN